MSSLGQQKMILAVKCLKREEKKGTWSSLPILLLWMIKDKLDIFDNMRLAVVCRDWWSASACYPKRLQSVGDGLPWIWQVNTDFGSWSTSFEASLREFISVTREDKFSVNLPEFQEARVLFSKQGWLLLRRQNFSNPEKRFRLFDSVFLINPFTRAKIKLPDVFLGRLGPCVLDQFAGSFSTREGYPHRVALLKCSNPSKVIIRTAFPGDEEWTEATYFCHPTKFSGYSSLVTIGQNVYCYDVLGWMLIYNMASKSWKHLSGSPNAFLTELDGEIVKIQRDDYNFKSFKVFRYNDADTAWERLSDDAVRDTSWFVTRSHNCFSVKEKGLKVYDLRRTRDTGNTGIPHSDVFVHDLLTGTTKNLRLPYPLDYCARWVDIG